MVGLGYLEALLFGICLSTPRWQLTLSYNDMVYTALIGSPKDSPTGEYLCYLKIRASIYTYIHTYIHAYIWLIFRGLKFKDGLAEFCESYYAEHNHK